MSGGQVLVVLIVVGGLVIWGGIWLLRIALGVLGVTTRTISENWHAGKHAGPPARVEIGVNRSPNAIEADGVEEG